MEVIMKNMLVRILCAMLTGMLLFTGCGNAAETKESGTDTSGAVISAGDGTDNGTVTLSEDELYDKLLGGWIGQMVGVTWAASTEFRWQGEIIPKNDFPEWSPSMINDAFGQDDLYVEIPFLDAMKENGASCDPKYLAEKFRDSQFPLWHANYQGRENLRNGIEYPDSGSYLYNYHADDIDWQIECDFLGQMYPGLVNRSAERAFEVGHIMNYGDGVYGGVFITAMHAAAYTADSVEQIVEAGLAVIPEGTKFKDLMNDVMESYRGGDTWQQNWQKLEDKWTMTDRCIDCSGVINIDAKLNSAYVLIGLLYGNGDMAETIRISGRCGQDSDCNPSSAASILGNFYGASGIENIYKEKLDYDGRVFSHTEYTLNEVLKINFSLMKEILEQNGAVRNPDGTWVIAADTVYEPVAFEQWPDGISALLHVTPAGGHSIKTELVTFGTEAVESVTYDMGDGVTSDVQPVLYTYASAGEYTVACTVKGINGSELTVRDTVVVEDKITVPGKAICSVTEPTGGGNKNMDVIYDNIRPAEGSSDSALQYDTYIGGKEMDSVYAGVEFDVSATMTSVEFTEGKHFWDGGWFTETPVVEILTNGTWTPVETAVSPEYPIGGQSEHGKSFETYTFTLAEAVVCEGVRLVGEPGGDGHFISIGEITPVVSEVYETDNTSETRPSIICSVSSPTGGGSSDITVICDGVVPLKDSANDKMQYDTYTGGQPDVPVYIGYLYPAEREMTCVVFTEGNHFNNGGWFKNGDVHVEVRVNGVWIRPECTVSPAYPSGDAQSEFGSGYETYTFTLNEAVMGTGIRLCGTAGGSSGFISVSELEIN